MSSLTRSCLIALTALSLSACVSEVGNGRIVTLPRTVSAFSKVEVRSGLHATLSHGPRSVSFVADENLHSYLQAAVIKDTLIVRVMQNFTLLPTTAIRVLVANEVLEGLEVSGGSQVSAEASPVADWPLRVSGGSAVTVTKIDTQHLDIEASGGSDVTASGLAPRLTASGSGGSEVDTDEVSAEVVSVSASGGSVFRVRASRAVDVSASGGSQVRVSGNPASRSVSATGGSRVTFANE